MHGPLFDVPKAVKVQGELKDRRFAASCNTHAFLYDAVTNRCLLTAYLTRRAPICAELDSSK
jgi:hypothetical protein